MTRQSLIDAWNRFFFEPQSPLPVALFRIIYGILVMATLMLLRPDWLIWFGTHSWVTLATMQQVEPGTRINLFTVLPQSDRWIGAFFWVFLASAAMLTFGFLTRINSVAVFLCLTSMQQRNLFITHGGDTFLRVAGFFLMFAPAGAMLSLDRLIRVRRGREGREAVPLCRPWAQRMIQFELAVLYFATFCWKMHGGAWLQGTALYYVYHLDEIRRFPVPPLFLHPLLLRLGTWAALVLEFSLGVLIWIRRLRYYILAAGLLFHMTVEYSLNIPLFEWDVLSGYILFVDPKDLARIGGWLRGVSRRRLSQPAAISRLP